MHFFVTNVLDIYYSTMGRFSLSFFFPVLYVDLNTQMHLIYGSVGDKNLFELFDLLLTISPKTKTQAGLCVHVRWSYDIIVIMRVCT